MKDTLEKLRYPTGKFSFNANADGKAINQWITDIENLPSQLRKVVKGLTDSQLDTTYREGGWSLREVVHHVADSHMNAYCRIKLAITENHPAIKPYDENAWAKLEDSKLSVEISLSLIDALHSRWIQVLKNISADDFNKAVFHPESKRDMTVNFLIQLYAWHGKHHTAHITSLRERKGW